MLSFRITSYLDHRRWPNKRSILLYNLSLYATLRDAAFPAPFCCHYLPSLALLTEVTRALLLRRVLQLTRLAQQK
ncbi:MAG: hypothetical protein AAF810_27120, partial [Cyanobacteria bacterium P01_D01_bin.36]